MDIHRKKKNRKIKVILLIVGIIIFTGGVFWLGMKFSKDKKTDNSNHSQQFNTQKKELETKLLEIKDQINKANDPEKKKKLEQEQKKLEQQIQNLGGSNNPNNPPPQNPPKPPQIPLKINRQLTIKYNDEVGGKHEYININDQKERILIDKNNPIFSPGANLCIKSNQYNISFLETDAQKNGNCFIFDQNNSKFQLTPTTPPLPGNQGPSNNSNDKIELEVKWNGQLENNYWLFTNSDWPVTRKRFHIAKNHPIFKGKKVSYEPPETPFNSPNPIPNFRLSFLKKDASKGDDSMDDGEYFFDENNNNFTLNPVGNWPVDPNYDEGEETQNPNKDECKVGFQGQNSELVFFSSNTTGTYRVGYDSEWKFRVSRNHPQIKKLANQGNYNVLNKVFTIRYGVVDNLEDKGGGNYIFTFNEFNKELEITED